MFDVVPSKRPQVSVVVTDDLKAALERWAGDEGRTVSNLCERKLRQVAIEAGYLPPDLPTTRTS